MAVMTKNNVGHVPTQMPSEGVMTSAQCAEFLGIAHSTLYKLTMTRQIPHYKPTGKLIFFMRDEVEAWLRRGRVATNEELETLAEAYCKESRG